MGGQIEGSDEVLLGVRFGPFGVRSGHFGMWARSGHFGGQIEGSNGVIFGVRNEVILGSISGSFWPKRGWPFLGGQILALGVRFWS